MTSTTTTPAATTPTQTPATQPREEDTSWRWGLLGLLGLGGLAGLRRPTPVVRPVETRAGEPPHTTRP